MRIVYSSEASDDLDEIFAYNRRTYGARHAADYVLFLQERIDVLIAEPDAGTPVEGFPDRRAIMIKRRPRGHGHIAVYRIEGDTIRVLHVFHTAQDVQGRMGRE